MPDQQPAEQLHSSDREPMSTDVDLSRTRPGGRRRDEAGLLAVIAAGGASGAAARFVIGASWPTPASAFPFSTLAINVLGCALIGVLMVLMTEMWSSQRRIRAFLGTGVLGGFTTFSTYAVDIQRLAAGDHVGTALLYLALTPVGALLAVSVTAAATRRLVNWRMQ